MGLGIRTRLNRFVTNDEPRSHWLRQVMNSDNDRWLGALPPERYEALEVSGDLRGELPWKSYDRLQYPDFDLCAPAPQPRTWDVVICEQVLEHVVDPVQAVRTLHQLTAPGGRLLVSTPFLLKIHGDYGDYWRYTPGGLQRLLTHCGFDVDEVRSWGNRPAAIGALYGWTPYRKGLSLKDEPEVPITVWAYCRRPSAVA